MGVCDDAAHFEVEGDKVGVAEGVEQVGEGARKI